MVNTNRLHNLVVIRRCRTIFLILQSSSENIDEHWAAVENDLFLGVAYFVEHAPQRRHKTWLTAGSWKPTDERKGLKAQLITVSCRKRYALELRCRDKSRELKPGVSRDKRKFTLRFSGKQKMSK